MKGAKIMALKSMAKKRTRPKVKGNVGKSYTETRPTSKAKPTGGSKFAGRSWGIYKANQRNAPGRVINSRRVSGRNG